jgi:flagellar hook-associated protein 3 FlgL
MQVIGDLARSLILRQNQVSLRTEMDQLAEEIATGFVKDPGQHLDGDISSLLAIDRSLEKLEAFRVNTTEAVFITGAMQNALDEIQTRTEILSQALISAELTPNSSLLSTMSDEAESSLGQVLNGLNRSVAGRSLFAGTATDGKAVQTLDQILTDARTALSGAVTMTDIETALDTFFGAGGTYETTSYIGSNTGLAAMRLSETETAHVDIRATDPVFREVLKPLIMAALATDSTLGFDQDVQVEMLASSGRNLLGAQQYIVELRAGLGTLEARVEESQTRNEAERAAMSTARLGLAGADQYESASRYENIRVQLESLYAITARSQRLSLAEYL